MLRFLLADHLWLAGHAMLLFVVGLFVSWPVVHYRVRAVEALPLWIVRRVLQLFGASPSIGRMALVIGCFNSLAIFIYMASGFISPLLPKLFGIWTGLNVGIVAAGGRRQESRLLEHGPQPGQWVPPRSLVGACGLVVLALELPCFWFAIGMGISLGHAVAGGADHLAALALRARAYACAIVPALFLSALAESVAIRGASAAEP